MKPPFKEFNRQPAESPSTLDRESFRGLSPTQTMDRIIPFIRERRQLREITLNQRRADLTRILRDFASKGLDFATLQPEDVAAYREYLRELVDKKFISESYAAHLAKAWNAVVRAALGRTTQSGERLVMRGFPMRIRLVQHYTEDDMRKMFDAVDHYQFRTPHYRELFRTYLETAWCTGGRIRSYLARFTVGDIAWEKPAALFRHMKNKSEHNVVLTPRAAVRLRRWVDYLRTTPLWRGSETPVFIAPAGVVTSQWINRTLKRLARLAGIQKPITTHVIRKSVGTLIARENPKLAQEQLGISWDVFNKHYNQPLLEDRIARRDILPGYHWEPSTPEETIAKAYLEHVQGRLSQESLEASVEDARKQMSLPTTRWAGMTGYA